MDHTTPEREAGAAQITLARYTHALPEDILKARDTLAANLPENQKARAVSMAIEFSPVAATKFPTGGHRFSPPGG